MLAAHYIQLRVTHSSEECLGPLSCSTAEPWMLESSPVREPSPLNLELAACHWELRISAGGRMQPVSGAIV